MIGDETMTVRRVSIAGLGTVGRAVAERIDAGLDGYQLGSVSARDVDRARAFTATLRGPAPVRPLAELADTADVVVECLPAAAFREVAAPTLDRGLRLVVLSAGALLDNWDLVDLAARSGGKILVPSGAILGLDALQAAAEDEIHSVRMTTHKPVASVIDAPYLADRRDELEAATEPVKLFEGSARDAIVGFPANLNVAVAVSLAGVGPDRTGLDVWAVPGLERNTHRVEVSASSASFRFEIENVPSENPPTGRMTALSVIALLRKLAAPLQIGT